MEHAFERTTGTTRVHLVAGQLRALAPALDVVDLVAYCELARTKRTGCGGAHETTAAAGNFADDAPA